MSSKPVVTAMLKGKCHACGKPIKVGDTICRDSRHRYCLKCVADSVKFMDVSKFYEFFYGEIYGHEMGREKLVVKDKRTGKRYGVTNVMMGDKEGIEITIEAVK